MRRIIVLLAAAAAAAGCGSSDASQGGTQAKRYRTIGRDASHAEIRAWDIDANPAGAGLPTGRGTYAKGVDVYARQCAACHGAKGEGLAPYPRLIGAEPKNFPFGDDAMAPAKTIGNYWPYATTLFDYVNRAMPFAASSTLTPDEVYSVVAFLLAENGIISKDAVMNARTLPAVKMPARDRFVLDDRKGGPIFR
jgi:cytochrome c